MTQLNIMQSLEDAIRIIRTAEGHLLDSPAFKMVYRAEKHLNKEFESILKAEY